MGVPCASQPLPPIVFSYHHPQRRTPLKPLPAKEKLARSCIRLKNQFHMPLLVPVCLRNPLACLQPVQAASAGRLRSFAELPGLVRDTLALRFADRRIAVAGGKQASSAADSAVPGYVQVSLSELALYDPLESLSGDFRFCRLRRPLRSIRPERNGGNLRTCSCALAKQKCAKCAKRHCSIVVARLKNRIEQSSNAPRSARLGLRN